MLRRRAGASATEIGIAKGIQAARRLRDHSNANDLVVTNLRDTHHVRWLFADLTMANGDSIAQYADLRYREGNFGVHELRRP